MKELNFDYYKNSVEIFDFLKDNDWSVFLCSNYESFKNERYDIISCCPIKKILAYQNATIVESNGLKKVYRGDPINVLKKIMTPSLSDAYSNLPFSGGAIGYFSYDLGNKYESVKPVGVDTDNIPIMAFGIYDWAIIIDHELKKSILIYSVETKLIKKVIERFNKKNFMSQEKTKFSIKSQYTSNLTYEEYLERFNSIKSYIEKGDCYQINFAQRFSLDYDGDTWEIFKKILPEYKSPYSSYMNFPFVKILSYSPERFLKIKDSIVETKPIKGTRPTHSNNSKNLLSKNELIDSNKDRAENLMIVDLLRNDIGSISEFGSVNVENLFSIKTFETIHHMETEIQGKLRKNITEIDIIKSLFPGGSITGAPKYRAMQIIDKIENYNRELYTGCIGSIQSNGDMDFNICIRTMTINNQIAQYSVGGGIVWDSTSESEYLEAREKANILYYQ